MKESTYSKWSRKIDEAVKKLELNEKKNKWRQNAEYLAGTVQTKGGSEPLCNEVSVAARDTGYVIYPDNPFPAIRVYRQEDEEMTEVLEKLLHQEMHKAKLVDVARQVIQDNRIAGIGFFKIAYEAKWDELHADKTMELIEKTDSATIASNLVLINQENQALLMSQPVNINSTDFHQLHIAGHSKAQEGMNADDPRYYIIEEHKKQHILQAKPLVATTISIKRVAPHNFIYDPDATCWEDRQWEAERTIQSIADLKANPLLKNVEGVAANLASRSDRLEDSEAGEVNLQADSLNPEEGVGTIGDDEKYVEVWNIHDIKNNKLIIMARPHKERKVLYEGEFPYSQEIPIYVRLVFNEINDKIEGVPDLDYVIAIQKELVEIWKKRREHVKRFGLNKLLRERGAWDDLALSQFRDPNQYEVEVPPGAIAKTMVFQPAAHPGDAYSYEKQLREDIRRYMGVQEVMQDIPKSETATQAQILGNWFNSKLEFKRAQVARAIAEIGKAILLLHKQFTETELMIRLTGLEGTRWISVDPKDIPEDFEVEITAKSWQDANPEVKKRQWTEVLQLLLQMPEVDRTAVIRKTLEIHGISNPDQYLNKQPPMMPMQAGGIGAPAQGQSPEAMAQNASLGQQVGRAVSPVLNQ